MLNKYEWQAIATFLTDWPQNFSYKDVLDDLELRDGYTEIWFPFESCEPKFIIKNIEDLKNSLERNFIIKAE